jgi:NDP-sugar pyrophosphorylase family protein
VIDEMQAIIMAGGKGRRLRPYTAILPKPLMPMGEIPILEIIVRQLKFYGFKKITLAVGYLAELLQVYFGSGDKWGIEIDYSREESNLGTIGPLTLIEDLDDSFLVMNGDILTDLNFNLLFRYHKQSNRLVTIATYLKQIQIDLGVLEVNSDDSLVNYIEKPNLDYRVSMGVYIMDRNVLQYIPRKQSFDIPDLMLRLLEEKISPKIYLHKGKWLDIGRKEDYENALDVYEQKITEFLPMKREK